MHNMSVTIIMHIIIRWECENVYPVEGQAEPCKESAIRLPSSLSSTYSSSSTSQSLGQSRPQGLAGGIVGPEYSSSGYILGCSQRLAPHLWRLARTSYSRCWSQLTLLRKWWFHFKCNDCHSMKGLKFLPWMPTDLFKKVKIFRLPTGSQTDLLEMVKIFRYPRGSQLIFLI